MTRRIALAVTLLMLVTSITACRNTKKDEPIPAPEPKLALEGFDDWAKWVPDDAIVLGVFDGATVMDFMTMTMPPERPYNAESRSTHIAELDRDFGRASVDFLGIDLTNIERLVVAASEPWQTFIIFGDAPMNTGEETLAVGELTAKQLVPKKNNMGELGPWVVQVSADPAVHVIFPTRMVLDAYIADPKSLADTPARKKTYEELFAKAPVLGYTLALILDDPELRESVAAEAPIELPTAVIAELATDVTVTMLGEQGALDGIKAAYDNAVAAAGVQVTTMRGDAIEQNDPSALFAIIGLHTFNAWKDSIVVGRPAPTELSFKGPNPFQGPQGMIGLAGLLGAGAYMTLGAFSDALTSSFEEPYPEEMMAGPASMVEYMPTIADKIGQHFKKSKGCTPPPNTLPVSGGIEGCCAAKGAEPLCAGLKWDGPGWRDIGFTAPGTHKFVYQFTTTDLGYGEFETVLTATTKLVCGDPAKEVYEVVVYATPNDDGSCEVSVGDAAVLYPE